MLTLPPAIPDERADAAAPLSRPSFVAAAPAEAETPVDEMVLALQERAV